MFATPLPRERPEPGKRAVRPGSVVWVDLDEASADGLREIERLRPHLWVASGAGQHLYWRLRDELEPAELEELNRRLCHRLGGDPACCEYGRIMRLPGTFNQKRGAVVPDPARRPPPRAGRPGGGPGGAARPRPAAAGRTARADRGSGRDSRTSSRWSRRRPTSWRSARVRVSDGGGLVRCPLPDHDDAYASCQVYAEAEQGWWCFGCQRGGRIYDLASLLAGGAWGRELRGEAFRSARELVGDCSRAGRGGVTCAARAFRSARELVSAALA